MEAVVVRKSRRETLCQTIGRERTETKMGGGDEDNERGGEILNLDSRTHFFAFCGIRTQCGGGFGGPFRALVRETMTLTKLFTEFRLWLMNWMTVVAVVLVSTSEVREVGERRPSIGWALGCILRYCRYKKTKVRNSSGEREKNGRETLSGGTTTRSEEG